MPSQQEVCFISMALVSILTQWVQLSSFQGWKVQKFMSDHHTLLLHYIMHLLSSEGMLTHGHVLPHIHSRTLQPFAPHLPVRPTFNDAKERTSETGKQKEWNVASANEVEVIHGRKRRGEEFWMQYVFKGRNLHNLWQMIDRTGRGGKGEQGGRRKWMSEAIL